MQKWFASIVLLLVSCTPADSGISTPRHIRLATTSPEDIRQHILVAAGLWPELDRPPLSPIITDRHEYGDYTVENIALETWPGFFLTGNLYRPAGRGPFPAVIVPHGHWQEGRLTDTPETSPLRFAASLATLGFVVFSYDMVGYGDFTQLSHRLAEPLWGISLLGTQLWNSIRAVDLVAALPEVDATRIGVAGASGGATQAFLLTAVDDRIAVAAFVDMLAPVYQGGCRCENAPGLRIDLTNADIAAAALPRPLLVVSAQHDWTRETPRVMAPLLAQLYRNAGVEDHFQSEIVSAGHNFNRDSREKVYSWLTRWLLPSSPVTEVLEPFPNLPPPAELAVFNEKHPRPTRASNASQLVSTLKDVIRQQLVAQEPHTLIPALRQLLAVSWPNIEPTDQSLSATTLFVTTDKYAKRQANVLVLGEPETTPIATAGTAKQRRQYATTYYRTRLAEDVQAILTALAKLASGHPPSLSLIGEGEANIPVLIARALVPDDVIIDRILIDPPRTEGDEETLWRGRYFQPGMLRIGGLKTLSGLLPPGAISVKRDGSDEGSVVGESTEPSTKGGGHGNESNSSK